MIENFTPTEKTKVRRLPKRGLCSRKTIYRIFDEAVICHVGFTGNEFDGLCL
jgi:nitroimidazol reductase NimA-like FMN-containing flavoprotein (pyridoxamine 5'-phosphate oxidase superfamily)